MVKRRNPYTVTDADREVMQRIADGIATDADRAEMQRIIGEAMRRGMTAMRPVRVTETPLNDPPARAQYTALEYSRRCHRPPFAAKTPQGAAGWERIGGFLVLHDQYGYVQPGNIWAARWDEAGQWTIRAYWRPVKPGQDNIPIKTRAVQVRAGKVAAGDQTALPELPGYVLVEDIQAAGRAAGAYVPDATEIWAVWGLDWVQTPAPVHDVSRPDDPPEERLVWRLENPRGLK